MSVSTIPSLAGSSPHRPMSVAIGPAAMRRATGIATWVAAGLVLGLIAQEGALIYQHIMYRAAETTPDVTYRGAIMLTPLVMLVAFTLGQHPCLRQPPGFGLMLWLFLLSTLMSVTMSATMCLERKYFVGDLIRFLSPWATLFLSYQAFRLIRAQAGTPALLVWYDRLALIALFDALITIFFGTAYFGWHISNWFYIYLVGWVILSDRHSELTSNLTLGIVLFATAVSQKRTNFVLVLAALVIAFGLRTLRGGRIFKLCFTLVSMVLAAVLAQSALTWATGQDSLVEMYYRMCEKITAVVLSDDIDNSYEFRRNEVRNVQAHFAANPWMSVFGVGFGGEVPILFDCTLAPTDHGNMHHVHKGHWIYMLRNGYCGLTLLAVFSWVSTVGLIRCRSSAPLITASCAVYAVTRIVGSIGGNLMLEDFDLPLVVGLGYAFADNDLALEPRRAT